MSESRPVVARAGDYSIPYVAQMHMPPAAGALLLAAGSGMLLAGMWAGTRFGVAILALELLMAVMTWALSRNRVTLDAESLKYRGLARERVIRYADIDSVGATQNVLAAGRGVGIAVLLHLELRREPSVDINVTALSERDRAIIVDHLQRSARNATFSRDLQILWSNAS